MKILIVSDGSVPSSQRMSRADFLARGFSQLGHEVTVLCPQPVLDEDLRKKGYEKIKLIYIQKFEQRNLVRRGQHLFWLLWKLKDILKLHKFDILRPIALLPGYAVVKTNKNFGYPVVTSLTDFYSDFYKHLDLPLPGLVTSILAHLERVVIKNSDVIVVDTPYMRELWGKWGLEEKKGVVLPHGINDEIFKPKNGLAIREKYGLNKNKIVIFHGDFGRFEGLDILVKAIQLIVNREPTIKVIIIGEGSPKYIKFLRKLIGEKNLTDYFIFTGWIPHLSIPDYLTCADICVVPCQLDGLTTRSNVPNKILEYIAMNKPIIATAAPGLKLMFGESIQYIPDGSAERLAEEILHIFNNSELREKLIERTKKIRSYYLWNKIVSQEEKIMYALLKNRNTDFHQFDWQLTYQV